jgi:ATP-binding cassette, subfamily D (ALD), peroxisomal long-chain fatty acid import protein
MAVLSKPASFQQQARIPALIALAIILFARGRILDLSKLAISRRPHLQTPKATPEELQEAIKQLYIDEADGSKTILVPFRDRVSKVRQSSSLLPLIFCSTNVHERCYTRLTST